MITFEIFILYRDRPLLVAEQLKSIRSIKVPPSIQLNVIISDNSTRPNTIEDTYDFAVRYRGNVSVQEHVNSCIRDSTATRFMLVHDDDIICPDILVKIEPYLTNPAYTGYTIVGRSQIFTVDTDHTTGRFGNFITVHKPSVGEFLLELFVNKGSNYPAFPAYVYHRDNCNLLNSDISKGGRFSDVSMLMPLYSNLKVYWLPMDTYFYRLHHDNDGHVIDIASMLSLVYFISQYKLNLFMKLLTIVSLSKNVFLRYVKAKLNV